MPEIFISALLACGIGYLLGSIPFGLIFARLAGVNLRSVGSGNIGATNVLRTGKKFIAFLTLLFDVLKGVAAVWITRDILGLESNLHLFAAVTAFLGHCYPVWLKFNGGKGVATYFGLLMILAPLVFVVCALSWLITFAITRISSISSLAVACIAPLTSIAMILAFDELNYEPFYVQVVLSGILILRHRANIVRIKDGKEPKFGSKS